MRKWFTFAFAFMLAACASSGMPSPGFVNQRIEAAYLPLRSTGIFSIDRDAAGVVVAPNIAVTNAHNENLLPADAVLARSDYDLLFFRTDNDVAAPLSEPRAGVRVIAYGQGAGGVLREAKGRIHVLNDPVPPRCEPARCRVQPAFSYDAAAGPGFSGGPVVDAETGAVVGITFAFCPPDAACGRERMFAFPISVVAAEMRRLLPAR